MFAEGADELAHALDTAASIDGSRGRNAAMKVVLDTGSALVETERRNTKTLRDLLAQLIQITDHETLLSAKTKLLQERTGETTNAFLNYLVFHPNSDINKNDHIRGRCAALANSIDQSLAEYVHLNDSQHINVETSILHGTQCYKAHQNLYFTLVFHMEGLKTISKKYIGATMPAKVTRPAMSLYPDRWTMGTSRDAESQRGDRARRPRIPASPYQHLPVTQKALAPHTGIDWWETTSSERDILQHRQLMELDQANLSDVDGETFRKYGKKKPGRPYHGIRMGPLPHILGCDRGNLQNGPTTHATT